MKRVLVLVFLVLAGCAANRPAHRVESVSAPRLTLSIDPAFEPLPPVKFPIEKLTDVERRVFVDADKDRKVERMIVIQFEKVQAGSDFRFVYPSTPPRKFGAETYRFNTFVFEHEKAANENPEKEAGRTRAALVAARYVPARFYRVARLARVSDPKGLSEVILFYMESVDPPKDPEDEDGGWPVPESEKEGLVQRLESVIKVLAG